MRNTMMVAVLGLSLAFGATQLINAQPGNAPAAANAPANQAGAEDSEVKEKLTDVSFVEKAAQGGLTEVELARVAIERSKNAKVRQFAQRMLKDHTAMYSGLKTVAQDNRITVPDQLDDTNAQLVSKLKQIPAAEFDAVYVEQMKTSNDLNVGLFQNAAGEPTLNVQLRVFANKSLAQLNDHQKRAHGLSNTDRNKQAAQASKKAGS